VNGRLPLGAGPWSLVYEDGDLRDLTVDGVLVVSRIYAAVRADDWSTVPGVIADLRIEHDAHAFRIAYRRAHRSGAIAYDSRIELAGDRDGRITVAMHGVAVSAFRRNRIGLCVLHDQRLAGWPVRIGHSNGSTEEASFPRLIAPHQPFRDVASLSVRTRPGREATVRFTGEVFETEDQRNWGDASFKTYSTPAHLPRPVTVPAGTVVEQRVELTLTGTALALAAEIDGQATAAQFAGLRDLGLDRLRVVIADAAGLALAQRAAAVLPLDVVLRGPPGSWPDLGGLRLASVVALPDGPATTPSAWVDALRARLPGVLVGGGNVVQFIELNRARPEAGAAWAVLSFPLDPCVHAGDTTTLMDNVPAIAAIAESASALMPGAALHLALAHGRHPEHAERHRGAIGAAWLKSAVATAAAAGIAVLSLGPAAWLVEADGRPTFAGNSLRSGPSLA